MSRIIKKTIRFSEQEYEIIEKKLNQYDLDFTTFARNSLLNQKIKFPIEKEVLFELNSISLILEQISKRIINTGIENGNKRILLLQLIEIEKKLIEIAS